MNNINLFFNVHVSRSSRSNLLAELGDMCFSPIRYFFHGRTVWVMNHNNPVQVHHVASYHAEVGHCSRLIRYLDGPGNFSPRYASNQMNLLATIGAIITFVPGLLLGILFKSLAFLDSSVRSDYQKVDQHFTPVDRMIGGPGNDRTVQEVEDDLENLILETLHPKINALIVYGEQNVVVSDTDAKVRALNPKKIIVIGADAVNSHDPAVDPDYARMAGFYIPPVKIVSTVQEALAHIPERRTWLPFGLFGFTGKPYQTTYKVLPPIPVPHPEPCWGLDPKNMTPVQ